MTWLLITAYCACILCTGHTHGITKSGQPAITSYTIACDKSKLHQILYIEGMGYRHCTDTGKKIKGNRVDVYMGSHEEAKMFGVRRVKGKWLGKWRRRR